MEVQVSPALPPTPAWRHRFRSDSGFETKLLGPEPEQSPLASRRAPSRRAPPAALPLDSRLRAPFRPSCPKLCSALLFPPDLRNQLWNAPRTRTGPVLRARRPPPSTAPSSLASRFPPRSHTPPGPFPSAHDEFSRVGRVRAERVLCEAVRHRYRMPGRTPNTGAATRAPRATLADEGCDWLAAHQLRDHPTETAGPHHAKMTSVELILVYGTHNASATHTRAARSPESFKHGRASSYRQVSDR